MRPIKLVMSAFGSYGGEEVVDFSKIKGGLFLISGDTGSGKTTIFDGIMYALYNKLGGDDRETKMMRSEYADDKRKTFVEFTFEYAHGQNKGLYTVKRTTHFRKSGMVSDVTLTMPDGEVFVGKNKETDEKIQSIIGLDYKQFGKIVMIAQGQFRELIMESTKNRKEIFKSIFSMDIYEKIEKNISERFKKIYGKLKDNNLLLEENFGSVIINSESENAILWSDAYDKRDTEPEKLLSILESEIDILEKDKTGLKKVIDKKNTELVRITKQISDADKINAKFEKMQMAETRYKELLGEKEIYAAKAEKVRKAKAAYEVRQVQNIYLKIQKNIQLKKEQLKKNQSRLEETSKRHDALLVRKEEFEQKNNAKYTQLLNQKSKIENEMSVYEEYDDKRELYQKENDTLTEIRNQVLELKKQNEEYLLSREKTEEKLHELKDIEIVFSQYENDKEKILKNTDEISQLQKTLKMYLTENDSLKNIENDYSAKYIEWKNARKTFEQISDRYVTAQAAILAAKLENGKPCPVCGALEHINPAKMTEDTVTKDDLDKAKLREDRLEREKNEKQAEYEEIRRKTEILKSEFIKGYYKENKQSDTQILDFDKAEKELENKLSDAKEKLNGVEKNIDIAKKKIVQKEECYKTREKLETRLAALEKEIVKTGDRLNEQSVYVGGILAQIDTLGKSLSYNNSEEAKKMLENLEKEIEEIETEKQEIDDLTAECDKTKSLLKGKIAETKKQLETDENEFAKEYKNFENMLNKKGFDSIDSYKESILEDEQITLIEEQIEKYRDELNRLKSEIAVLNDMLADESIIDMEELLQAKLEMQVRVKQLNKENEDIISKLGNNVSVKKKIVNLLRDRGELDKKYRVIASLNNAANNKKIHFQTFVLRQYFNMVISYANKRLAVMTSNNFLLRCRDISFSTAGETGLELDVYSPVTGKVRDAHSLSGGETFMASLAMALGMSDIVQNKSGKTNIDTMFIDEGFGSLSDDVRDKAVRILLELAGSSRTVGVISHVSELKEQIPSKILVRKENDGSHITWSQDR